MPQAVPADPSPLKRLLAYARPHRPRMVLAAVCSVLNKLLDLAPPLLIGLAIDTVVRGDASALGAFVEDGPKAQLLVLALATGLIWIGESAFEYAYQLLWRGLAQDLQHGLRLDTFRHVQGLELGFFEERTSGGLLAVLNDDVNQLERFLDRGANDLLQVATTATAIGLYFVWVSPGGALLAALPIPLILFFSLRYQVWLAPRYAAVRERVGELSSDLGGALTGVATVQAYGAEAAEAKRIEAASLRYVEANQRAIPLSSAFVPLIRMLVMVGFVAILLHSGFACVEGELSVAIYSSLLFLTQRLLWPLTRLGETLDLFQRAMASAARLFGLLDLEPRIRSGTTPLLRGTARGAVRFEDVHFAYPGRAPLLQGLDLELPAGETTAVVGTTGAGKTTLVKLLLRHFDPDAGRILVDGHDLRTLDLKDLRAALAVVSQDVFVRHGSVAENLRMGRAEATLEELEAAARAAEAHDFFSELPAGYDTLVGERGQKLSGGQRQRLTIARAILRDPALLVLDEATASVDNETEAAIQRSLARIGRGRTVLVIAHRLSTVRHAQRIHVLHGGRVVESGRHEELLELGGIYAGLWRVQTGEEALEVDALAAEDVR